MTDKACIHLIAAARPNFMKVAPLWHALNQDGRFAPKLVHTGHGEILLEHPLVDR